MTFTFDTWPPLSAAMQVRLLIPDRVDAGHLFEDEEIDAFLLLESDNVRRATALALETASSDQALTLKVMSLLDLRTDGAAVAKELRARAATLRQQAADIEAKEDSGSFDVIEMVPDHFSYRERLYNEMLRNR